MTTRFRPLLDAEFDDYYALDAYCFPEQYHRDRYDQRMIAELRRLEIDGRAVAQLQIMPFELESGRSILQVGAIGGLGVAAEARNRGHADTLLRAACAEMVERGMALTLLHAFSFPFYFRKGWAISGERRIVSAAPQQLRGVGTPGGAFYPAGPDDIAELDRIYRAALRGRYGPLRRDEWWWRNDVLRRWDGNPYHARIWRDDAGNSRAYLIYRFDYGGEKPKMVCRDIVALDAVARAQLFLFMADHFAQVEVVEFPTPIDAPLNAFLPDPPAAAVKPAFLQRVLSVEALFAQYAVPADVQGTLTIAVSDDWWPAVAGSYRVEFAAGRCHAQRSDAAADLHCTSGVLSQLLSRFVRPRSAQAFGMLTVTNRAALALLESATAGLPPFCSDYF
jgi:predicted acetyltransferase